MSIYKRHRFPSEVIRYTVWLYYRFSLSFRDVEDLLAERGITVSYETIRYWCSKFWRIYSKRFFNRLLKKNQGVSPWKVVTDKLRSYDVAHWELVPDSTHDKEKYHNNRCESSH